MNVQSLDLEALDRHRTLNVERRIMMSLRSSNYYKIRIKNQIQHSMLDVQCSMLSIYFRYCLEEIDHPHQILI